MIYLHRFPELGGSKNKLYLEIKLDTEIQVMGSFPNRLGGVQAIISHVDLIFNLTISLNQGGGGL